METKRGAYCWQRSIRKSIVVVGSDMSSPILLGGKGVYGVVSVLLGTYNLPSSWEQIWEQFGGDRPETRMVTWSVGELCKSRPLRQDNLKTRMAQGFAGFLLL